MFIPKEYALKDLLNTYDSDTLNKISQNTLNAGILITRYISSVKSKNYAGNLGLIKNITQNIHNLPYFLFEDDTSEHPYNTRENHVQEITAALVLFKEIENKKDFRINEYLKRIHKYEEWSVL